MKTDALLKIDYIVFDFDGTLAELHLDFAEMKARLSELARSLSLTIPPAPFLPVLEWLSWLEERFGHSNGAYSGEFRERAFALIREMEMEAAGKGALFEFTKPMLRALDARGVQTAIITRNCDAAVRLVFPDIDDYCGAFFARDHVSRPKPDPAHLVKALEAIGADFGAALMVGDHPIDIQTGKATGVRTAGVFSGSATREDLLQSGADWVISDCGELVAVLSEEGMLRKRC